MKKLKITALLICLSAALSGCKEISQDKILVGSKSAIDSSLTESITEEEEPTAATYTEYVAEIPEITKEDADIQIEAEDCEISGSLFTDDERKGFSGDGYVTGFYGGSKDKISIPADIPANQHYDITVCVASDEDVSHTLTVDGESVGSFDISAGDNFVKVTFYGIYLEKGKREFSILQKDDKNFDIDYIKIVNDEKVYNVDFQYDEKPCNPDATSEAAALLKYMQENSGSSYLTGQYASDPRNKELDLIYRTTGKYPVIRFSDIGGYRDDESDMKEQIGAAKKWAEKGGIVGFMWYWNAPGGLSSVYSKETDFDLSKASTSVDNAKLSPEELEKMCNAGEINKDCWQLIQDIDRVSKGLSELCDANIPVLWRPLHEAGGQWYWWGSAGPDSYKWLYSFMYHRMTEYHGLDNLIWIWNGQSEKYMVDEDMYDIAAIDIYLDNKTKFSGRSEQYQWLKKLTDGKKLLAISECSSVPSVDDMLRDNSVWSFFGMWFGDYLTDRDGKLSEAYVTKDELIKAYNAENAVTLDKYAGSYGFNKGEDKTKKEESTDES